MLLSGTARQPFIEEVVVVGVQLVAGHILYVFRTFFFVESAYTFSIQHARMNMGAMGNSTYKEFFRKSGEW